VIKSCIPSTLTTAINLSQVSCSTISSAIHALNYQLCSISMNTSIHTLKTPEKTYGLVEATPKVGTVALNVVPRLAHVANFRDVVAPVCAVVFPQVLQKISNGHQTLQI
jgi:hypothetical protein